MKILTLLFVMLSIGRAEAAEPFGRASVEDAGPIVPGQQVHISVDVFAPGFFVSPPQFPLFDVSGTLVTLSNERAQNLLQTIDGVEYAGIRRTYSVVPQISGAFEMPEISIELGYANDGAPTKTVVRLQLPGFEVSAPAAQSAALPLLAATGLTISQSFDRDPASLKTGDALVRTITVEAQDTQAMLMPPVELEASPGLSRYVKAPILKDGIEIKTGVGLGRSANLGSSRTETVVYTAAKQGSFRIPAVSYPWFDVGTQAASEATLAATEVHVGRADATTERIDPNLQSQEPVSQSHNSTIAWWSGAAVAVAAAFWFGSYFAASVARLARRQAARLKSSRRARLGRLRAVIKAGSDAAVYQALQEWSRSLGYRSLTSWIGSVGKPQLAAQIAVLEQRLFNSAEIGLDRVMLARLVDTHTQRPFHREVALPPLNPTSAD